MRELAALLFGRGPGEEPDLFEPEDGRRARVRDSGEWCQSTPGHEAVSWLGFMLRAKGRAACSRGPVPWR
jgi:hypothetical protein